ncbi:unnamed protein product [Trichogramma brassicae]|uniref:CCHC-type domain-containing protein n=1 Tax=Trichogramma brassicae TaxID=86971 RepID=A0A6H5I8G1_9HYME|nr:unnamed protein product [Trichogramma brassicae]
MSRTSTNAYRARDLESRRSITSRRNDSRDPESNRLRDSYPPVQRNVSLNNPFAYTHYMPNSISLFNDIVKQIPKFDGTPYKLDLFSIAVEEAVEQLPLYERRIVRALESKLVGKAERMSGRLASYRRASELLRDLRFKFINKQVADKLALDLGNVAQPVDVDARQFGSDVRSLYEDAIAAYSQAPDINAIEREAAIYSLQNSVTDCFLLGLREPLQLQVRLKNPQCLADAIDIAGDIENKLRYRAVVGSNVTSVGLIGVRTHLGTTKDSQSERATDDKKIKCQLCKRTGHEAADCFKYKRATLKCSNCGLKGHEASTCRRPSTNDRDSRRDNRDSRRDNRDSRRDDRDSRRDSRDSHRDSRDDRDDRDSRRDNRSPRRDERDSRDTSVESNSRRNYYNRNNDTRRDDDRDRYARSASPDYRNSNNEKISEEDEKPPPGLALYGSERVDKIVKLMDTEDRTFHVKIINEITSLYEIQAGVPQGSVLGPTLYLLYTADLPSSENVTTATYADDTALLCSHQCPVTASSNLQNHISKVETWYKSWRMKVNETKSIHMTFTLCTKTCPSVFLNGINIPQDNVVKYLGIHLDRRLTWRSHIWTKRKQLNLKIRKMYWLLGRNSTLTLENKLLLYNSMLKPIWTYGIQLWGAASKSNIEIIERLQSKTLRCLVNAPWFVTNEDIRKDLKVPTVKEEICKFSDKYKDRLKKHPNSLAAGLGSTSFEHSKLKHRGQSLHQTSLQGEEEPNDTCADPNGVKARSSALGVDVNIHCSCASRCNNKTAKANQVKTIENLSSMCNNTSCGTNVYLQTLRAVLKGPKGERVVRVFLDAGSHQSYVLKKVAHDMKLKKVVEQTVTHTLFGGVQTKPQHHIKYELSLMNLEQWSWEADLERNDAENSADRAARKGDYLASFDDLSTFLNSRCRMAVACSSGAATTTRQSASSSDHRRARAYATRQGCQDCIRCGGEHYVVHCDAFTSMNSSERRELVMKQRLCFNCLRTGHAVRACSSRSTCQTCGATHHTLLHEGSCKRSASSHEPGPPTMTRPTSLATLENAAPGALGIDDEQSTEPS